MCTQTALKRNVGFVAWDFPHRFKHVLHASKGRAYGGRGAKRGLQCFVSFLSHLIKESQAWNLPGRSNSFLVLGCLSSCKGRTQDETQPKGEN